MALSKQNTHTHQSTSWEDDNDVRVGSGPFGSPDDRLASHRSASHHSFDDEVSALQRPLRPRRRDLMAGSRPRPIVPKSLSEAYRIAQAVCAAKMAPKGLETPEACMIAIMHGLEVGLSPLSALQRIAVINGRPTIWGDGALALVKASGLCEAIEEWIEGDDPQSWIAVCNLIRKHDPVPVERRFSSEDAKRAKLWGKSGPWSDYPKRMLQMRARAFALRDAFPDVLGGLYLTEEFLAEAEPGSEPATRHETETPFVAVSSLGPRKNSERETRFGSEVWSEPTDKLPNRYDPETQGEAHSRVKPDPRPEARSSFNAEISSGLKTKSEPLEAINAEFCHGHDQSNTRSDLPTHAPAETVDGAHVPHAANTASVTHQDNGLRTACATDPIINSGSLACAQSNAASNGTEGDWKTDKSEGQAQPGSASAPQIPPALPHLPPLANLRRSRSMPREVRALRFRNQWSVKQPLRSRKELNRNTTSRSQQGSTFSPGEQSPLNARPAPSRARWELSSDGLSQSQLSKVPASHVTLEAKAPDQGPTTQINTAEQTFIPPDDIAGHLDLYDAALCCATDEATLIEIAEEFIERLSALPRQGRQQAEIIFEKHQARIAH